MYPEPQVSVGFGQGLGLEGPRVDTLMARLGRLGFATLSIFWPWMTIFYF